MRPNCSARAWSSWSSVMQAAGRRPPGRSACRSLLASSRISQSWSSSMKPRSTRTWPMRAAAVRLLAMLALTGRGVRHRLLGRRLLAARASCRRPWPAAAAAPCAGGRLAGACPAAAAACLGGRLIVRRGGHGGRLACRWQWPVSSQAGDPRPGGARGSRLPAESYWHCRLPGQTARPGFASSPGRGEPIAKGGSASCIACLPSRVFCLRLLRVRHWLLLLHLSTHRVFTGGRLAARRRLRRRRLRPRLHPRPRRPLRLHSSSSS